MTCQSNLFSYSLSTTAQATSSSILPHTQLNPPQSLPTLATTAAALSFRPLCIEQLTQMFKWLPLPPDPNHPAWKNRCFDYFQTGHAPGACKGNMVCLTCLNSGHPARECPMKAFDIVSWDFLYKIPQSERISFNSDIYFLNNFYKI